MAQILSTVTARFARPFLELHEERKQQGKETFLKIKITYRQEEMSKISC